MYRISFLDGRLKGRRLTIGEPRITIGRDPECGVRLMEEGVAAFHAELLDNGGRVFARRMDAAAAVAVGGTPVGAEPTQLKSGDVLTLGPLRLRLDATAATAPPACGRRVSPMGTLAAIAIALMFLVELVLLSRAASRSADAALAAAAADIKAGRRARTPPVEPAATSAPSDRVESAGP